MSDTVEYQRIYLEQFSEADFDLLKNLDLSHDPYQIKYDEFIANKLAEKATIKRDCVRIGCILEFSGGIKVCICSKFLNQFELDRENPSSDKETIYIYGDIFSHFQDGSMHFYFLISEIKTLLSTNPKFLKVGGILGLESVTEKFINHYFR